MIIKRIKQTPVRKKSDAIKYESIIVSVTLTSTRNHGRKESSVI